MAKEQRPLSAKSSVGDWLRDPVGSPLLRDLLSGSGVKEETLRPVRMLALQRLVSLSQGRLTQDVVDDLVRRANGGSEPLQLEDDAVEEAGPRGWAREVLVVIGVGGMGELIARRQGSGRHVVLADFSEDALTRADAHGWL